MVDIYGMRLLDSKLSSPQAAQHLLARPRLTDRFFDGNRACLFLLVAPAGFGKTTLALQALSQLPASQRAWYHLDQHDTEPRRFLMYLIEALSRVMSSVRNSGLKNTTTSVPLPELTEELCYLIEQYKGPDCWLVLDNWEVINENKEHADIVLRLAPTRRQHLRMIVASRVKPSFCTRKLQEGGQAIIIEKDELAFTFPEFIDALRDRTSVELVDSQIERLWQQTSGWCVSIGLLLEFLKRRPAPTEDGMLAAGRGMRSFIEYMEEELMQGFPPELARFLENCSVLDVISPESAAKVIVESRGNIAKNLRLLRESAIPHVVLDQPETFRLHPLVRQAFNHRLRNIPDRARAISAYRAGAQYFREQGAALEAVQLLMDLPDYEAALRTIDEEWHAIVAANGLSRVRVWLDQFPSRLKNTPRFVKIRIQALSIVGENREIVKYLSDKLSAEQYEDDFAILGNLWIHYHWALLHLSPATDYTSTRRDWQALKRRCGNLGMSIEAGVHVVLSLAAHQELREDKAIEHSRICLAMLNEMQFDYRMTVKSNIALFTHCSGRSAEALAQLQAILIECEGREAFTIVPMVLINIAEVRLSCGQYRLALESTERALQTLSSHGMVNLGVEMYADRCRGIAHWYLGDTEAGVKHLNNSCDKSLKYDERERIATSLWLDYFHLCEGERRKPRIVAMSSLGDRSEQRLLWLGNEAVHLAMCRKWSALRKAAGDLCRLAESAKSRAWKVTANFLMALGADGSGRPALCKQFLRSGLRGLTCLGWSSYPLADDSISSFVIAKSARYGIRSESVRLLLRSDHQVDLALAFNLELEFKKPTPTELHHLLVSATDLEVRGLAGMAKRHVNHRSKIVAIAARRYLDNVSTVALPPLYVRMFGGFSVVAGSKSVVFSRKKSRQLLQILLIERCDLVHEETIIETLWPESDPAKSKPILQTCIKDLRRALDPYHDPKGKSYIVYSNEHYSIDLPSGSAVDTFEFEDLLGKAGYHQAPFLIQSQDQESTLRSAASLYRGELLPEERFEAYAVEYRERLLQNFLEISSALARFLMDKGKNSEAIVVLERGLQLDPLWGEGVQEMMAARVRRGELYRAFQTYRAYEKRLQQELAVPPDKSLTAYFEELVISMTSS